MLYMTVLVRRRSVDCWGSCFVRIASISAVQAVELRGGKFEISFLKTVRFLLVSLPGRHAFDVGLYTALFRLDCLPGSLAVSASSSILSWSSTLSKSCTFSGFKGDSISPLLVDIVNLLTSISSVLDQLLAFGRIPIALIQAQTEVSRISRAS